MKSFANQPRRLRIFHLVEGNYHLEHGRGSTAVQHFEALVQLSANEPSALAQLGAAYVKSGRYQDAVQCLIKVLTFFLKTNNVHQRNLVVEGLATSYFQLSDTANMNNVLTAAGRSPEEIDDFVTRLKH